MEYFRTEIPEVIIIEPDIYIDSRGYFMETFRLDKLDEFIGLECNFCQDSESKSAFGTLRGLHYQLPPFAQTKIVRVIEGKVLDVAVDIRKGSSTFGEYVSVELSAENKRQLFIPRGFAHGFVVLSETATLNYKLDNCYNPESERGIAYNDPEIGIDWILTPDQIMLSEKDKKHPLIKDL